MQRSEHFLMGAVLAVIGGYLDAYTYLVRGGVFANAQTGNVVLLGIHLIQGHYARAGRYLVPILAFVAGVAGTELLRHHLRECRRIHWRQLIAVLEAVVLAGVAFLPQSANLAANIAVSFVCALQAQAFRKVNGNACATTLCTGNLRSGTGLICRGFYAKTPEIWRKGLQYYGIILFFLCGATLGALGGNALQERAPLLCCALLVAVAAVMRHPYGGVRPAGNA